MSTVPPPPLPYATPAAPAEKRHSTLGMLSIAAPVLIICCVLGKLGPGSFPVGIGSPLIPIAAVIEAIARKKRLALPLISLSACITLFGLLYLALRNVHGC